MRAAATVLSALVLVAVPAAADPPGERLQATGTSVASGPSPYGDCAPDERQGDEGSPALLAASRPDEPVVVWQQDVSHGSGGDIVTSSAGLGSTTGDLGVGACAAGGRPGEVAAAPSLAVGSDGTRWAVTAVNGPERSQVVLASQRAAGAWIPQVVATFAVDAPSLIFLGPTVAVDPADPRRVHVAYVRNHFPAGTVAMHRMSSDGGVTWTPEHPMSVGPTPLGYDFAEQLVALGGDDLVAISTEVDQAGLGVLLTDYVQARDLTQAPIVHRARTSSDGGVTWSLPRTVLTLGNGGVRDRERGGTALRSLVRPSVAVGPDGTVHVAGESVAPDGGRTALLVARSADGGRTWVTSTAAEVAGVALSAAVAVDGTGRLALSWLDLSADRPGDATLDAAWRIVGSRDGRAWSPAQPLSDAFDLRVLAPAFVGDQGALLGMRRGFTAATVVGTGDPGNPSDVVVTTLR